MWNPRLCHIHWGMHLSADGHFMGETWGCIYKTGLTQAVSLSESPCVHMHIATWQNIPAVFNDGY